MIRDGDSGQSGDVFSPDVLQIDQIAALIVPNLPMVRAQLHDLLHQRVQGLPDSSDHPTAPHARSSLGD